MDKKPGKETPAWIVCVDLLNKAKRELVTQAMETLDGEIAAKRMDIKGSLINVPDQPSEDEMKLFVLGQVLENAESMRERYGEYIRGIHMKGANATAQEVEGADRARLLLMAVDKMEILINYSRRLDSWINDASMKVSLRDPSDVLLETCTDAHRKELLEFIKSNRTMLKEGTFTEKERRIMERAA
jgi:hypothetical protein